MNRMICQSCGQNVEPVTDGDKLICPNCAHEIKQQAEELGGLKTAFSSMSDKLGASSALETKKELGGLVEEADVPLTGIRRLMSVFKAKQPSASPQKTVAAKSIMEGVETAQPPIPETPKFEPLTEEPVKRDTDQRLTDIVPKDAPDGRLRVIQRDKPSSQEHDKELQDEELTQIKQDLGIGKPISTSVSYVTEEEKRAERKSKIPFIIFGVITAGLILFVAFRWREILNLIFLGINSVLGGRT